MNEPLAYRMRPKTLDKVLGQKKLVSKGRFLYNCIEANSAVNMIFFGPSGSGKTTIAEAFANSMKMNFIKLNATINKKEELLDAINQSRLIPTIIMIDEVHRLNKDKQDILLPFLENGQFIFIGATTANPLLSINKAIRSRTRLIEIMPLDKEDILIGLKRAIESENGLNNKRKFTEEALKYISTIAGGDLRYAYNILETSSLSFLKDHLIDIDDIKELNYIPNSHSDLNDDQHYDTVSALQKSIRGSQVDAAIFYLAKLLESNDLEGITRRLMVTAYEDIGLASPSAVDRCYNACQVALNVGLPEAMIPLGFTVVDLALSPKSKSAALAIEKAYDYVKSNPTYVRDYLKLTPVNLNPDYKYPYDRSDLWEKIEYMPSGLEDLEFYDPQLTSKYEKNIFENYKRLKSIRRSSDLKSLKENKE